jgi:hypothetical protein
MTCEITSALLIRIHRLAKVVAFSVPGTPIEANIPTQSPHPRLRDHLSCRRHAHFASHHQGFCFVRVLCLANVHLVLELQLHLWLEEV